MATLPYSRIVRVTLERNDRFPTIRGFGVPLVLTGAVSDATAGAVDGTNRVKVYGTIDEVAVDFSSAHEAYKTAQAIFQQNPAPSQVKIGYAVPSTTPVEIGDQMDSLKEYDDGWYVLVPDHTAAWLDDANGDLSGLAEWIEARRKMLFLDTADADTQNPAVSTSLAAALKDQWERSSTYYHTDATEQLAAATAAYVCSRNLDAIDSAYTLKFKGLNGIAAVDLGSAAVQGITGFVPGTGMDNTQGHYANTYIDIGGRQFLVEGTHAKGGFVDEIHASDWIVTRTEEEVLGLMLTRPRIPYTDNGVDELVQAVQRVMHRALSSGIITPYEDSDGTVRNWKLDVPRVASVSAAQRRQRIAPVITCRFRYSGAIHYSEIQYTMTF